ncbi:MAG: hypothetical protein ACTS22_07445 [Phycisphaerales bacterium]
MHQQRTVETMASELGRAWPEDLARAIESALSAGYTGPAVTVENLAWAVAWLVVVEGDACLSIAKYRPGPGSLADLRRAMTEQARSGVEPSPLARLARSVACEHRTDRQHPAVAQDPSTLLAHSERNIERLSRDVLPRVERLSDPEVSSLGWSAVFECYWSRKSSRRWAGMSAFSTLVIQVGRREQHRQSGRRAVSIGFDLVERRTGARRLDANERAEFREAYEACRDALAPRQRLAAALHFERGVAKSQIAILLDVGRPRVTALIDRATRQIGECLAQKGWAPSPEAVR